MVDVTKLTPAPNPNPPADSEFITLVGQQWPIPPLGIRQNRIVVPKLLALVKTLAPMLAASAVLKANPDVDPFALIQHFALSEEQMDMLGDVVYIALTRAHRTLSRDDFLDMPVGLKELAMAFPVIMKQCGFLKPVSEVALGEEAPQGSSQTGTG